MSKPARVLLFLGLGVLVAGAALTLPWRAGAPAATAAIGPGGADGSADHAPAAPGPAPRPRLPPIHITTTDAGLAAFLDRESGERVTPDIAVRLPAVTGPEEVAAVLTVLREPHEEDTVRHEAINLLRRSGHPGLGDELLALLGRAEEGERFRAFLAQHLGADLPGLRDPERERVRAELRAALDDRHLAVRREALFWLARARDETALQRLERPLADPAFVELRATAVNCLLELERSDRVAELRPLAHDPDPAVRIAALNALGMWRDEASRASFEEARGSAVERLQRAGALALRRLDGTVGDGAAGAGAAGGSSAAAGR